MDSVNIYKNKKYYVIAASISVTISQEYLDYHMLLGKLFFCPIVLTCIILRKFNMNFL